MNHSHALVGLTVSALVLPVAAMATAAEAAVPSVGLVAAAAPPTDPGGGDTAPDITPNIGFGPVISGDGSTIAFESAAPLTADDVNTTFSRCTDATGHVVQGVVAMNDIYAYDVATGELRRVSRANETGVDIDPATGEPVTPSEATGFKIDGHTGMCVPATNGSDPVISEDGSQVAFVSGGNLVGRLVSEEGEEGEAVTAAEMPGTTDGTAIEPNIYENGPSGTLWVSDDGGSAGRELPAMSADGRYVVLVGRSQAFAGVYVKDTWSTDPATRIASGFLFNPDISADGSTIAWVQYGSGDTGGQRIYAMKWQQPGAKPYLVSLGDDGQPPDGVTDYPSLNEDGSLVAFQSMDKTLDAEAVAGLSGGGPNKVYVRDTVNNTTEMVSLQDGTGGNPDTIINGQGLRPAITPDGRYVVFASDASGLQGVSEAEVTAAAEEESTETFQQVYVRDLQTQTTIPVSLAADGAAFGSAASATAYGPSISDDGRYVVFESDAGNLVEGDTNGDTDAFVRDMQSGTTTRISHDATGQQADLSPDSSKPRSHAFATNTLTNRERLTVRYVADDPVFPSLGVAEVRLYVKGPGDTAFVQRRTDSGTGMDGKFIVRTGGVNGVYAFKTQAVDGNGNVENLGARADTRIRFDNTAPTIKALRVLPSTFDLGSVRRVEIRTRVPETAYRVLLVKHDGIVIKHFTVRKLTAGLHTQLWYGRNDAGVKVHDGRYVVILRARDQAGNVAVQRAAFRVVR